MLCHWLHPAYLATDLACLCPIVASPLIFTFRSLNEILYTLCAGMLFDWLYPAYFPTMLACLEAWADTPEVCRLLTCTLKHLNMCSLGAALPV